MFYLLLEYFQVLSGDIVLVMHFLREYLKSFFKKFYPLKIKMNFFSEEK